MPADDLGKQKAEPLAEREMMSILSGSTGSILPGTTDGAGAADHASGTASGASSTADEVEVPDSDASGSASRPVASSEEGVDETFSSSDSAAARS